MRKRDCRSNDNRLIPNFLPQQIWRAKQQETTDGSTVKQREKKHKIDIRWALSRAPDTLLAIFGFMYASKPDRAPNNG